jgi:hypothetical protein
MIAARREIRQILDEYRNALPDALIDERGRMARDSMLKISSRLGDGIA